MDPKSGFTARMSSFVKQTLKMGAVVRRSEPPKAPRKATLTLDAVARLIEEPRIEEARGPDGTLRMGAIARKTSPPAVSIVDSASDSDSQVIESLARGTFEEVPFREFFESDGGHWERVVLSDELRATFLQSALKALDPKRREDVVLRIRLRTFGRPFEQGIDGFSRYVYAVLDQRGLTVDLDRRSSAPPAS